MTKELKTLKDLKIKNLVIKSSPLVKEYDALIRAEAVKWVKFYTKDLKKGDLVSTRISEVVFWITNFFNLTEEDLWNEKSG